MSLSKPLDYSIQEIKEKEKLLVNGSNILLLIVELFGTMTAHHHGHAEPLTGN